MDVYNWEQGFFVQDDWKLTSRLTLNLGLALRIDHSVHREERPDGEFRS